MSVVDSEPSQGASPPALPLAVGLWSSDPTVVTAATLLGLGRATCYRYAREGLLPTVRIGGRVLVPVSRLRALLDEEVER